MPRAHPNGPLRLALRRKEYRPPRGKHGEILPPAHRLADFLDWMAKNYPYQALSLGEIIRVVDGRRSAPPTDTPAYREWKRHHGHSKRILREVFGREPVYVPSGSYGGYRATVDANDFVACRHDRDRQAVAAAHNRLDKGLEFFDNHHDEGDLSDEQKTRLAFARSLSSGLTSPHVAGYLPGNTPPEQSKPEPKQSELRPGVVRRRRR